MKNTFPGYYRPSEEEFSELWDNCLFVLDANVLLNLYRYTPDTRNELLQILESIKDRLWVPYQAAFEYQKNRLKVISTQREAYDQIDKAIGKIQNQLENELRTYLKHPYLNVLQVLNEVDSFFSTIQQELHRQKEEHPDLLEDDSLRETITSLLEGKVGSSYSPEELEKIFEEGRQRYAQEIPPGYRDTHDKDDESQFGDLVLWHQTIDKATDVKKPIILVTDDRKEDWWWTFKGRMIGPRPELVSEILTKAGVSFYMYQSDQFMEYAREHLKQQVDQQAIDEVRSIRERDEELRKEYLRVTKVLDSAIVRREEINRQLAVLADRMIRTEYEGEKTEQQMRRGLIPEDDQDHMLLKLNELHLAVLKSQREYEVLALEQAELNSRIDELMIVRDRISHQAQNGLSSRDQSTEK
jgi:hypothetical protein